MPFLLVILGLTSIAVGVNGTYTQFFQQLKNDAIPFAGYATAIGMIGAAGYVSDLRTLSRAFMTLIILSLVISQKGFFTQFAAAIKAGPQAPQPGTAGQQSDAASIPDHYATNVSLLETGTNSAMNESYGIANSVIASNASQANSAFGFLGTAIGAFA